MAMFALSVESVFASIGRACALTYGRSGVWRDVGRDFPTAGFAHPAGYGGAERCSAKPRLRPRRATFFLASPRKKAKKATRLHRSFAWANDSPALLTTGGRRRTRPSGSDSCAGLPRPLLRGSKVQTGFQRSTEPLRKPIRRLTVDHLHFRSPLTCRLEVMTGGKRASHV